MMRCHEITGTETTKCVGECANDPPGDVVNAHRGSSSGLENHCDYDGKECPWIVAKKGTDLQ